MLHTFVRFGILKSNRTENIQEVIITGSKRKLITSETADPAQNNAANIEVVVNTHAAQTTSEPTLVTNIQANTVEDGLKR